MDSKCAEWTNWGEWSECTQTCGGGMTKRSRQCVVPKRRNGKSLEDENEEELPCPGPSMSVLFCNLEDCPPSVFEWTQWSSWSDCSRECGDKGNRHRQRECEIVESVAKSQGLVVSPKDANCPGKKTEAGKCNIRPCSQWTEWGTWTTCSASCGDGQQSRKRSCKKIYHVSCDYKLMNYIS